jgi:hypothetical protein
MRISRIIHALTDLQQSTAGLDAMVRVLTTSTVVSQMVANQTRRVGPVHVGPASRTGCKPGQIGLALQEVLGTKVVVRFICVAFLKKRK